MSLSFQDLYHKPEQVGSYLRTDWTPFEEEFKRKIPSFEQSVRLGNPSQEYELKGALKDFIQTQSVPKVIAKEAESNKKVEKNFPESKETVPVAVESTNVTGSLGDPQTLTSQPKELVVPEPESDPLDFLFPTPPQTPNKAAPATAPVTDDDPFSDPLPKVVQEAPKPTTPEVIQKEVVKKEIIQGLTLSETSKETPFSEAEKTLLSDFNHEQFAGVKPIATQALKLIQEADLSLINKRMPEFVISTNFDEYREKPAIISDGLVEVHAKKVTVHAYFMRISELYDRVKFMVDMVTTRGLSCSAASNREKRMAQVQIVAGDLFSAFTEVKCMYDKLDNAYKNLQSTQEILSRLLTWHSLFPRDANRNASFQTEAIQTGIKPQALVHTDRESYPPVKNSVSEIPPYEPLNTVPTKSDEANTADLEVFSAEQKKKPSKFSRGQCDW